MNYMTFPFVGTLITSPAFYSAATSSTAKYGYKFESINTNLIKSTLYAMTFTTSKSIVRMVPWWYLWIPCEMASISISIIDFFPSMQLATPQPTFQTKTLLLCWLPPYKLDLLYCAVIHLPRSYRPWLLPENDRSNGWLYGGISMCHTNLHQ